MNVCDWMKELDSSFGVLCSGITAKVYLVH